MLATNQRALPIGPSMSVSRNPPSKRHQILSNLSGRETVRPPNMVALDRIVENTAASPIINQSPSANPKVILDQFVSGSSSESWYSILPVICTRMDLYNPQPAAGHVTMRASISLAHELSEKLGKRGMDEVMKSTYGPYALVC